MKNQITNLLCTAALAGFCAPLAAKDGFTPLFNGKDLSDWVTPKGDHAWKVIDGVIDYEAKGGNLVSKKEYSDYVLQLEWRFKRTEGPNYNAKIYAPDGSQKKDADGKPMTKAIPNADSGVFLRGTGQTQVNLWCWPCGSGQLWAYQNHKDPAVMKGAIPICNADKPVGEWNEMEITLKGEKLDVILNGKKVIDTTMPGCPAKGPIALQHHGGFNEKTKEWNAASALIQFRDIKIKELTANGDKGAKGKKGAEGDWKPLWNGKDFTGFTFHFGKQGTENKGTFTAKDDVIVVSGKPSGYMVTEIFVNDLLISTVSDCELTSGPVAFQSEGKEISLRNIRIIEK